MKKLVLIFTLLVAPVAIFAEDPPMRGWSFNEPTVWLNGRGFVYYEYASSFREQDGYAIVDGERVHFWLYDTYAYHNGDGIDIHRVAASWVEKMGYVIDYDNMRIVIPNTGMASSVKALMSQRGCDMSITIRQNTLIINDYDKSKGIYWTTIYPLYK